MYASSERRFFAEVLPEAEALELLDEAAEETKALHQSLKRFDADPAQREFARGFIQRLLFGALVDADWTDTACFMWGYELDPYVEPDLINKSIMKARIPLRESMLLQAAGSIMKNAVQLVARKARSKVRHPMRYGLPPPTPEDRKGGGA